MRIIATEEHMMTAEVAQAWQALGLEVSDPGVAYHGVGDIGPRLLGLSERRIADMDAAGIDVQVLSLTTPALHDLGPDSVDMARRVNDAMAAAIMRYPDSSRPWPPCRWPVRRPRSKSWRDASPS